MPQARGEQGMSGEVHWAVFNAAGRWIVAGAVIALVVVCRANRAWTETAAAVRADVADHRIDAVCAKGALVGADPGVGGAGRQRLVAVFAGRSQFQHGCPQAVSRLSQ